MKLWLEITPECRVCGTGLEFDADLNDDKLVLQFAPCPSCMKAAKDHGIFIGHNEAVEDRGGK
jgi:hypothetical protein